MLHNECISCLKFSKKDLGLYFTLNIFQYFVITFFNKTAKSIQLSTFKTLFLGIKKPKTNMHWRQKHRQCILVKNYRNI